MATVHPIRSATASLHEGIVIDTDTPAVIFNPAADAGALMSFAHGQLSIMEGILLHMSSKDHGDDPIADPLLSLIRPAMAALQNAAAKLNNPA
jgi:hypothetical protein